MKATMNDRLYHIDRQDYVRFHDSDTRVSGLSKRIQNLDMDIEQDGDFIGTGIVLSALSSLFYGGSLYSLGKVPALPYDDTELGILAFGGMMLCGLAATGYGVYSRQRKVRKRDQLQDELDRIVGTELASEPYSRWTDARF